MPFRRIALVVHIAFSILPGTNLRLSQVKHLKVNPCDLSSMVFVTVYLTVNEVYVFCMDLHHKITHKREYLFRGNGCAPFISSIGVDLKLRVWITNLDDFGMLG